MELILFWAVFAVAAGVLAKGKNRRVVPWAILGLFIGPFAVLVVALVKTAPGEDQGYQ
ncbi:hypothetical protein [Geoalkalibacter subterraneus]|jgi:hypothetical protein|uniref:hypothetical protein n=1 Tax=Geoalkalibacter subterraneus TaxID=483547 RepID=UPI00130DA275|nr:hypothetical protein [Geoalkalibacter subterraneus]